MRPPRMFKCFYQNRFFVIVLLPPRKLVDIIENRSNAGNRRRLSGASSARGQYLTSAGSRPSIELQAQARLFSGPIRAAAAVRPGAPKSGENCRTDHGRRFDLVGRVVGG